MRIVDPFYAVTTATIVIGLTILTYMKFGLIPPEVFHVTIVGSKVDSILLAYQLAKLNQPNMNITIIGKFDQELQSYADSSIENDKVNMASLYSPYIDRKMVNFCGSEPLFKELLQDIILQYKIKRAEILFNKGTAKVSDEQLFDHTYSINKEQNTIRSMFDYGLSHITAQSIFEQFETHIENGIEYDNINLKSIRQVLNQIMPDPQMPSSNGLTYLSELIGLDQKYIRDYISPVVSSSYFHNVNSVATIFKVLPLYCKNLESKGRTKNLALLLDERVLAAKLLIKLHEYKNIELKNSDILNVQDRQEAIKINVTDANNTIQQISTDMLLYLEDFQEENQKQISYYRAIVDGIIANDDQYEQVYTIHFQKPPILSISRLCAVHCKNFKNNVYLVISRSKITQKDLVIFAQHQLISNKKVWVGRSVLPSMAIKMQERNKFYRIVDTQLISDNYEMKLIIFKSIATMVRSQMYKKTQ